MPLKIRTGFRGCRTPQNSLIASAALIVGIAALLCMAGPSAALAQGGVRTFVPYRYIDPAVGMEAFRLLIPKGWRVQGAIRWSANPALPAQSQFRFYNPSGPEELNLFPTRSYFWTDNRIFLATNPPGSLRFGSRVARPVSLHDAIANVVIPGAGRNRSGLQMVYERDVPELARLARGAPAQGVQSTAQGGKMRIRYREQGRPMEEEFFAAVSQFVVRMPGSGHSGGYFINYWYVDYAFSCRDEQGRLDSNAGIFKTMIFSMKVNPQWFAKVANVKEILARKNMQQIRAIGRIGSMVAQAGSRMREDQQRDWERRQQVQDRIARNFSDHIRGVDRYYDPQAGKEVELPAGHGHAWSNNRGEYIVTESPGFNPNVGSNLNWQPLTPVK